MLKQIPLKSIVPDEAQPRKYFNAEKLKTLKDSITKFGIINPLTVQDMGNGTYLLEDGERRFRAAVELGLKEVPCNVVPLTNEAERKVRQFNIQEQHEAWTPVEKAVAISDLAGELGLSVQQTCKLLNLTSSDATRYSNFASLVDKNSWVQNEVPLDWAAPMVSLQTFTRNLAQTELKEDWSKADAKALEGRVISMVKSGVVQRRTELNRLKDAFIANPKMIAKFLEDKKSTPVALFAESKAEGAYYLRQFMHACHYARQNGNGFLKHPDVALTDQHVRIMREAVEAITKVIGLKED